MEQIQKFSCFQRNTRRFDILGVLMISPDAMIMRTILPSQSDFGRGSEVPQPYLNLSPSTPYIYTYKALLHDFAGLAEADKIIITDIFC